MSAPASRAKALKRLKTAEVDRKNVVIFEDCT